MQAQLARLADAPAWLDSRLEAEFLFELRQHPDLPEPLTQQVVEGERVDFYWPDHRVVLEIDGDRYHSLRRDRLNETRRDEKLTRAGYAVLRVSEVEFKADPERVFAELRALLRLAQAP